jgi:hypothetical protein
MKTKPFYGASSGQPFPGLGLSVNVLDYLGADGSTTTPPLIANKTNPIQMGDNSLDWNKHFPQTASILFKTSDFEDIGQLIKVGEIIIPLARTSSNSKINKLVILNVDSKFSK